MCETPKSPPGDYNLIIRGLPNHHVLQISVKHLNPRQGITTDEAERRLRAASEQFGVKHLNPRQGITTVGRAVVDVSAQHQFWCETPKSPPGDYNVNAMASHFANTASCMCETPKSPPGDYNLWLRLRDRDTRRFRVKHLNPRQGITTGTSPRGGWR